MGKFSEKCKKYLKWANFTLGRDTPRYKMQLFIDFLLAMAYAIISTISIWMQQADRIVLLLNIFCLLRALIKSTINAAEATKSKCKICKVGIEEKHEGHSHYHYKVCIMSVVFLMTMAIYIILFIESSSIITKFLATFSIAVVLCNDVDDIVICAYDANV